MNTSGNMDLFGEPVEDTPKKNGKLKRATQPREDLPEKLGKAIRLPVPDFNDPDRKPTCLEVDFPIAQINALSNLEGNAGKPIYQMSKWWARRRSSVFRSMLIAAGTEAPDDPSEAAKKVWEHYYCNHQKAGSFKNLKVLDCFMGGGTTLVEGSRLGMQMTGVDLNPVAWFVVKNELACSDPEQVKALFDHIEKEVKPQIQPFYTTTCPRGHKGRWIDIATKEEVDIDPIDLAPEERKKYRWEGPEVIYTFWAKHGTCTAKGCKQRTPIFRTPVIAQKKLSTSYIELTCQCGAKFDAELGETRISPNSERIILSGEQVFTEMSQAFARELSNYDHGINKEVYERSSLLLNLSKSEKGLFCPNCGRFAGEKILRILEKHTNPNTKAAERKKKAFGIKRKAVFMWLLINPDWLKGTRGEKDGELAGGYAGAPAHATQEWNKLRLNGLSLLEIRGHSLPSQIASQDGIISNCETGSVPKKAHFTCSHCGKEENLLKAVRSTNHTAPVAAYALQCHCPQCEQDGYNYGGRYFKAPNEYDIAMINGAETEWETRRIGDLSGFWASGKCGDTYMLRNNGGISTGWMYTHWWKMFNSRQLIIHSSLVKSILGATDWPLDVKEQVLGAMQQYLRMQSMLSFWHQKYDKLAPALSSANFHPKSNVVETNFNGKLGYGRWTSCRETVLESLKWVNQPWELMICNAGVTKSQKAQIDDPVLSGSEVRCCSSTDLSHLTEKEFDLIITDPPFGNNLFYADLADYFYSWIKIPLAAWYNDLPEGKYFQQEQTPHSMEAIDNSVEHPDDRASYEKQQYITANNLEAISSLTGSNNLSVNAENPLFRPVPSSEFYSTTLSACWAEAGKYLRPGGIMAFTFHHNDDQAWIDILQALFDAGFFLIATYPIRSDETKGEGAKPGTIGSQKIEYDIVHVCRKRLKDPEPVSWARMRRWVKSEAQRLKELLEHTHAKELPESDLRVILRGKSLEFYSRHYGQVFTGDGQLLEVRDALLGINQLLDDLLEDTSQTGGLRPPDIAEPPSRLYLRLFHTRKEMPRDELHKTLRGTGISQGDLEAKGWIRVVGKMVHVVPVSERFDFFTAKGRNRKVIKTDLDQTHFLIGAALPDSGINIESELNKQNFVVKKAVDQILQWYAATTNDETTRLAAKTASQIVEHWRNRRKEERPESQQLSLFEKLEEDAGI